MRTATPARALRMAHLADLQYYHQTSSLSARFVSAPLLTSQPVVECVLSIPPYLMTHGGRERALARAAFEAWLPPKVALRRHKGDTTRYHLKVLERQIAFVREVLLEGELPTRGLVDRAALEETLQRDFIVDARAKAGVMTALVAELWLRRLAKAKAKTKARASHSGAG
jgi:asparagine synthase (glutamine-hydrolysing)